MFCTATTHVRPQTHRNAHLHQKSIGNCLCFAVSELSYGFLAPPPLVRPRSGTDRSTAGSTNTRLHKVHSKSTSFSDLADPHRGRLKLAETTQEISRHRQRHSKTTILALHWSYNLQNSIRLTPKHTDADQRTSALGSISVSGKHHRQVLYPRSSMHRAIATGLASQRR